MSRKKKIIELVVAALLDMVFETDVIFIGLLSNELQKLSEEQVKSLGLTLFPLSRGQEIFDEHKKKVKDVPHENLKRIEKILQDYKIAKEKDDEDRLEIAEHLSGMGWWLMTEEEKDEETKKLWKSQKECLREKIEKVK